MKSKQLQQGFTLIEIIVVFTLLAMIMVMIFAGIDSSRRAVEKGEKKITAINEIRVVQNLIRRQLSRAMAIGFAENDTGELIKFIGDDDSITYVSQMPGYLGNSGPHIQKFEIKSGNGGKYLQFRHGLLSNNDDENELSLFEDGEPIVLLENIGDARFSFIELDEEGELTDWTDSLINEASLPLMVQLDIEMNANARERWPLFQVAIQVDGSTSFSRRNRSSVHSMLQESSRERDLR
ncbi:MAG: prepilin-type N-terminal cleavage/methylation domain-containing protein [Proteobacteria bacterium]|nr:prepilin-type N-terminal cleavage/methylation domain-containing protein [Pseudomonadota bacterium]